MALKRQHDMTATFSMASMTDVIFLLLIFFMVTSTFVMPNALEVNLPESSQRTSEKPSTRIYIDKDEQIYAAFSNDGEAQKVDVETLDAMLAEMAGGQAEQADGAVVSPQFIAIYSDRDVTYGKIVEVLDLGARNGLKMVLATTPAPRRDN